MKIIDALKELQREGYSLVFSENDAVKLDYGLEHALKLLQLTLGDVTFVAKSAMPYYASLYYKEKEIDRVKITPETADTSYVDFGISELPYEKNEEKERAKMKIVDALYAISSGEEFPVAFLDDNTVVFDEVLEKALEELELKISPIFKTSGGSLKTTLFYKGKPIGEVLRRFNDDNEHVIDFRGLELPNEPIKEETIIELLQMEIKEALLTKHLANRLIIFMDEIVKHNEKEQFDVLGKGSFSQEDYNTVRENLKISKTYREQLEQIYFHIIKHVK